MLPQLNLQTSASALCWMLVVINLFLSVWVIIPAPIFGLLPLSVGAPEISPAIVGLNVIVLILAGSLWRSQAAKRWRRWFVAVCLVALSLGLSSAPLLQVDRVRQQADSAMVASLGRNYLQRVPSLLHTQFRSQPFVLSDLWQGMSSPAVRIDRQILFAAPAGVHLSISLYRPARVGKYPAIVSIYGGAWQRGSPDSDADFNRYLAARGYVVWAIDYRHAPTYHFPAQIDDVRSALNFINERADRYETDRNHVAIIGRSAGAQLAMLAAYDRPPIPFRAVIDYYGPVDLTAGYLNPPVPDPIDSRTTLRAFLGDTPQQLAALYRQASPITAVKPDLPPTLLIYGGKDRIVESKYGRHLADTLMSQGNRAVFIEIPWADHAFDAVFAGLSNQIALYYTERFLAWAVAN